jgi:hypothetical protein
VNRRSFLKLAAAAPIAGALQLQLRTPLRRLYGDGIHDDTLALQQRLDRGGLLLMGGYYRITDDLIFRDLGQPPSFISGCQFEFDDSSRQIGFVLDAGSPFGFESRRI